MITAKPSGIKVRPLSTKRIRAVSQAIRKLFSIPPGAVDVIQFLEGTLLKAGVDFQILSKEEMGRDHGLTYPDAGIICIREDVYIGACEDNGRDRFTILHEAGHLVLHTGVSLARSTSNGNHAWYEDSEWQANAFAAEFLMPVDEILQHCNSPQDIVDRFLVSYEAAEIRWHKLVKEDLLPRDQARKTGSSCHSIPYVPLG